jgi:transposase-like protein
MKKKEQALQPTRQKRTPRFFSEELKRRIVKDLEENIITISDVCREYTVSRTAVYKWMYKYSHHFHQSVRQVVELNSEVYKTHKLIERIAELERIIGSKQIRIDVLEKIIELGSKELAVDIKKKFASPSSTGF